MEQVWETITGDLRLALLAVGALFLSALLVWADDDGFVDSVGPVREIPLGSQEGSAPAGAGGRREPTFSLPQVAVRDRLAEPRVVDLESAIGPSADGAGLLVVDSVTLSDELSRAQSPFAPAPPEASEAAPAWVEPVAATVDAAAPPSPQSPSPQFTPQTVAQVEPERHIVRQSLQGEGFVHGDMQIFHRSAGDGRTLLSAASLTMPGSFDLATMDAGFYRGLNLFAVLPGPLPGRDTVVKLLLSGHTLAQRLRGDLLDSRGEPLTESRLAEMRREAAAADPG